MRVRLLKDLTKYHSSLTVDSEGEDIGAFGKRSRERPTIWTGVQFEHFKLDVLRKHLEQVREEAPEPKEGPILPIRSDIPPRQGQVIEFAGVEFEILSLHERTGEDTWLVQVHALEV